MAYTNRTQALDLFEYCAPGMRVLAVWANGEARELPEAIATVYAPDSLPMSDVQRVIPLIKVDAPCVKMATVTNVASWLNAAFFSLPDGSSVITTPANWGQAQEYEMKQINAQVTVDSAAVAIAGIDYDILSEQAVNITEMLVNVALGRQGWTKTPDANGYTNFYEIATTNGTVIDPPEGTGAPLSVKGLLCLRQQLGRNVASRAQYSYVLAEDQYDGLLEVLYSSGNAVFMDDPVDGERRLCFDGVRVCPEPNMAAGNAALVVSDRSVLPPERQSRLSARASVGAAWITTDGAGPVVSSVEPAPSTDRVRFTVKWNVGLMGLGNPVAWMENLG